jgi:membrane-bound lytic murein transglycosylase D
MDPPLEYDTVDLPVPTNLALVSDLTETPLPQLTELNPAVLCGIAPQGYALHVPKGTGAQLSSGLELIPAEHRGAWRMHRVESGETLASIGKRFGVAPATIVATNNLKAAEAPEGERLLIPSAARVDAPARRPASATAGRRTPSPQRRTAAATTSAVRPVTSAAPKPQARPAAAAAKPQPKPVASSYRPAAAPAAPPAVMLAHSVGK